MINLGTNPFYIQKGDRIAQLAIRNVLLVELIEVDELHESMRGSKGFGSSGMK